MTKPELIIRCITPESLPRELTNLEKRQLVIAQRIIASLQRRNLLATPDQSVKKFTEEFHLEQIDASPEFWLSTASGLTDFDPETGRLQVWLNPFFDSLKPSEQLVTVLEETIHVHQLSQLPLPDGRYSDLMVAKNEVEAKERVFKIAGFLGLNDDEVEEIRDSQRFYLKDQKEPEANVWENFPYNRQQDTSERLDTYREEETVAQSNQIFEEALIAVQRKEEALKALDHPSDGLDSLP